MIIRERQIKKTKKPHNCWGCRANISTGFPAYLTVSVDDGQILSTYWCRTCVDQMSRMEDPEIYQGELGDIRRTEMLPTNFMAANSLLG